MELREYLAILRRRWVLVAVAVIVAFVAGYVRAPRAVVYTAQATIYVGPRFATAPGGDGFVSNAAIDAIRGLDQIIVTYAHMIRSRPIAVDALARAKVERSVARVLSATQAEPEPSTLLLRVRVRDSDPGVAQRLANGMAEAFVDAIQSLEPASTPREGDVPQLPANLFERASLPLTPAPNNVLRHALVGGVVGLVIGVGLAFLRENLDITIKGVRDAERRLELPVLGVIPFDRQPTLERTPSVRRGARAV